MEIANDVICMMWYKTQEGNRKQPVGVNQLLIQNARDSDDIINPISYFYFYFVRNSYWEHLNLLLEAYNSMQVTMCNLTWTKI
jgi:hypothetical protein